MVGSQSQGAHKPICTKTGSLRETALTGWPSVSLLNECLNCLNQQLAHKGVPWTGPNFKSVDKAMCDSEKMQ